MIIRTSLGPPPGNWHNITRANYSDHMQDYRASVTNGSPKRIKDYPAKDRHARTATIAAGIGIFGVAISILFARGWWLVGCLIASAQFFAPAIGSVLKRR